MGLRNSSEYTSASSASAGKKTGTTLSCRTRESTVTHPRKSAARSASTTSLRPVGIAMPSATFFWQSFVRPSRPLTRDDQSFEPSARSSLTMRGPMISSRYASTSAAVGAPLAASIVNSPMGSLKAAPMAVAAPLPMVGGVRCCEAE